MACDDGSPKVVKIKRNNLYLSKQFSKISSKMLSCKWDDKGANFFTGHGNGNIIK
jgi:hypothetical protein